MDIYKIQEFYEEESRKLTMRGAFRQRAGWIQRQVEIGRVNPSWLPMLIMMENMLEEFYPGHWDIQTRPDTNYYSDSALRKEDITTWIAFEPVVHFPKVTLRNSRGHTHQMEDLFLKFRVRYIEEYGQFQFSDLMGMRATISHLEYQTGFNHSHISGSSRDFVFRHCCTGSGEVNDLFALLNADFDQDTFRLLLLQLTTYAGWESLEGIPYKKMAEIKPAVRSVRHSQLTQNNAEAYADQILVYLRTAGISLDWRLEQNIPKVNNNAAFKRSLLWLGDKVTDYQNAIVGTAYIENPDGTSVVYAPEIRTAPQKVRIPKHVLPFRGKPFPFTVHPEVKKEEEEEETDISGQSFYLNPLIVNDVISKLESRALKYADPVRAGVLSFLQTQADPGPQYSAPDPVSV